MKIEWMAGGQYGYPRQSAISPDGNYILTANQDSLTSKGLLYVWDAKSFELKNSIPAAEIRFTSNGKLLLGSYLWNIEENRAEKVLDSLFTSRYYITNDEKYWIFQQHYGNILLKNADEDIPFDSLPAGDMFVAGEEPFILLKPYGQKNYFRYNITTKEKTEDTVFNKHLIDSNLTPVQFITSNDLLLKRDSLLMLYNFNTHSFSYRIPTISRSKWFTPQFSSDATQLGFMVRDTLKIYDALKGELIHSLVIDTKRYGSVNSFSFAHTKVIIGHTLMRSYPDIQKQYYAIWDINTGTITREITHFYGPTRAFWTRTNQHFIVADFNRINGFYRKSSNLSLWYSPSRRKVLDIDTNILEPVSLSPNDDLIAYRYTPRELIVKNYFSQKPVFYLNTEDNPHMYIGTYELGFDSLIAIGFYPENPITENTYRDIEIYNIHTGELVATLPESYYAYRMRFSHDKKYLAAGCDGGVKIWETGSWRLVRELTRGNDFTSEVNFMADTRYLVTSTPEGYHKVIDLTTGSQVMNLSLPIGPFERFEAAGISVIGNSNYLIGNYYDREQPSSGKICIWDLSTGKRLKTFTTEIPVTASLSVSQNGRIINGAFDGTVAIWENLEFPTHVGYEPGFLKENSISAFPNPASSNITFEFKSERQSIGQIEIFNTKGVLQKSFFKELFKEGETSFTVSTENLPAGVYYAKITNHETVQFVKFVVL